MNFKLTFPFLALLLVVLSMAEAQVRTVNYDFNRNTFDGDYDLPANTRFNIIGLADSNVHLVEIDIYRGYNKKDERNLFYSANWLRAQQDAGSQFFCLSNFRFARGRNMISTSGSIRSFLRSNLITPRKCCSTAYKTT